MYEDENWVSIGGEGDITKLAINTSPETTVQHGAIIGAQKRQLSKKLSLIIKKLEIKFFKREIINLSYF